MYLLQTFSTVIPNTDTSFFFLASVGIFFSYFVLAKKRAVQQTKKKVSWSEHYIFLFQRHKQCSYPKGSTGNKSDFSGPFYLFIIFIFQSTTGARCC
jgi:hypothetical protein